MKELWHLIPIGIAVIAASLVIGPNPPPPGGTRMQRPRDVLVSTAIIILGAVLIAMPFAYDTWSSR